jgi:hypothetical protein
MSSFFLFGLSPDSSVTVAGSNLKQVLVARLKAEPDLVDIIGQRVYPSAIPQGVALPALAYRVERSEHETDLAGSVGVVWVQIRFEILSPRVNDCENVKEVLRNLFVGYSGPLGSIQVLAVKFQREQDQYHFPIPGSGDSGTHSKQFDFRFKVRESIPTNT